METLWFSHLCAASPPSKMSVETLAQRPTAVNADAVAFCPYESLQHLVVCGCYELDSSTDPPSRSGRLVLHSTNSPTGLDEVCGVDDVGVLDCLWLPEKAASAAGKYYLAVATSDCNAELYSLQQWQKPGAEDPPLITGLTLEDSMACEDAGAACMGLAWSSSVCAPQLALSGTTGRAFVGQLAPDGLKLVNAWQAHDLECWAVAFGGEEEPHTLFTGGDDSTLKRWDLRTSGGGGGGTSGSDSADEGDAAGPPPPVATASNRRSHSAGVCCISPCPWNSHLLATGSYDEKARLWDARMLRAPLTEHECGGGVWRLKWHPEQRGLLLAACMHAGFAVIRVEGLEQSTDAQAEEAEGAPIIDPSALTLDVVARYEAHGMGSALGYGADWAHRPTSEPPSSTLRGATASFYDRQLHLWSYDVGGAQGRAPATYPQA
jgi:diphthamide biosynthesis protein 7